MDQERQTRASAVPSPGQTEGEGGLGVAPLALPGGRLFFALWPDAATVVGLNRFARTWLERQGPEAAATWRLMQPDTLHLTLAFLGQVEATRTPLLTQVLATFAAPPLAFTLDRWGWWPHNRILWAGCAQPPPALLALGNGMQVALVDAGFPLETRSFLPHVTLLRGRAGAVPGGGEMGGCCQSPCPGQPMNWFWSAPPLGRGRPIMKFWPASPWGGGPQTGREERFDQKNPGTPAAGRHVCVRL